ncbi:MAG: protein kinase domain-containing protein [Planctomycetota bacterium]|jgi:Tol biopolymer transport system component
MTLAPGQSLSHYEILGPLGAGGMGEVYRARDTRLEREVAIKVLPDELAGDAERLRRFEREAKTLASLNNPHVAGIHGIDQVGDTCFIAMELVPGEDLAARLVQGPLDVREALDVCRQLAEGLEAAHEAGVVHRDLKPANVKVTPDGVVKILDFGLAKPLRPGDAGASGTTAAPGTTTAQSDSFLMTEEGVVLGTPTYMSPEQARGRPVDRRTDVWAFGCVLYECLTGRRPFGGDSLTDVLAAIVHHEPDWAVLPADTPRSVRWLLHRCLVKEPRQRLRDVGEARVLLEAVRDGAVPGGDGADGLGWGVADGVVGADGTAHGAGGRGSAARLAARPTTWLAAALVAALAFIAGRMTTGAAVERTGIRPDAALMRDEAGNLDIVVQPLRGGEARRITTDPGDDAQPAWSPDGSHLAFVSTRDRPERLSNAIGLGDLSTHVRTGGDIFIVPAFGGSPVKLVDDGGYPDWSPSGKEIVFQSLRDGRLGLWVIAADGGEPRRLSEVAAFHPAWSPDGRFIAFAVRAAGVLGVVRVDDGETIRLLSGHGHIAAPAWSPDGRYLYFSSDKAGSGNAFNLWRIAFRSDDPGRPGEPERVTLGEHSDIYSCVGEDGELAFSSVRSSGDIWELTVESGALRQVTTSDADEDYPHVSRNGRLVVSSTRGGDVSLWTMDLQGGDETRLTPGPSPGFWPRWSPDGSLLAYGVTTEVGPALVVRDPREVSAKEVVPAEPSVVVSFAEWSADGASLVYSHSQDRRESIFVQPLDGKGWQLTDGGTDGFPTWSPDGTQIAYNVTADGRRQVWVVDAAGGTSEGARADAPGRAPRRISPDDGRDYSHPQWSPTDPDRILVVLDHHNLAAVSVATGEVTLLTRFEESTVFVDYASWGPDGEKVYFHFARRTGDVFLLQGL